MNAKPSHSSYIFAAAFIALSLIPGAWTIAHTPVANLNSDVIDGAAQRHYEERFEDMFLLRDSLRQTWSALKFGLLGEMDEGAIESPSGILFTAEEFMPPQETRDFGDALLHAKIRVEAAGAELVPVIIPDKARMLSEHWPQPRSASFIARYDVALTEAKALDLRAVDLRKVLGGPMSFMKTDTHWSPEGAQSVAVALAEVLKESIQVTTTFHTTQTGGRDFKGDLVAFADTGVWRPLVGPASETIGTFETFSEANGGLGLFGEAHIPVALVGTSFSARQDFHFEGFLKSELQADVVSFALQGQGPFTPMDRFLDGEHLEEVKPDIVLWEIPERYLNTWSDPQ
ncbi:MAG: hypothetical protein MK098_07340 [Marinovum sp.]|nr:hypothetical protein [Marinovum sp.]